MNDAHQVVNIASRPQQKAEEISMVGSIWRPPCIFIALMQYILWSSEENIEIFHELTRVGRLRCCLSCSRGESSSKSPEAVSFHLEVVNPGATFCHLNWRRSGKNHHVWILPHRSMSWVSTALIIVPEFLGKEKHTKSNGLFTRLTKFAGSELRISLASRLPQFLHWPEYCSWGRSLQIWVQGRWTLKSRIFWAHKRPQVGTVLKGPYIPVPV